MEILAIALASLLGLGSSGGIVLDRIAQNKIRSQVISVEQQAVRIDNQPNYRVAQGKLARVRIASRGVRIQPGIRISSLDLETDPIAVKSNIKLNNIERLRESLAAPAAGALKVVLTEKDLNQALQSTEIQAQLQKTLNHAIASKAGSTNISYQLSDIQLKLRPKNRLQVSLKLSRPRPKTNLNLESNSTPGTYRAKNNSRELAVSLELTVKVINGKRVRLLDPQGTVNGRPMSSRLLNGFATGISDRLNLNTLSADGILARILQLEINEDNLQLISFVRLETKKP
jgi:hypothetical protein